MDPQPANTVATSVSEPSLQQNTNEAPPHHHAKYFFDDVPVIFKVEDCLFKVHKHFLIRESAVFQTMFLCPPSLDGPEGESEDRPIVLPGVKIHEFEALLDFFYESMYNTSGVPSTWLAKKRENVKKKKRGKTPSLDERKVVNDHLIALLSIATRFDFDKVRSFAIGALDERISDIDPIERICLSRQHEVNQWLRPAYVQICQRPGALEEHEGDRLGMKTVVLIAKAREAYCDSRAIEREMGSFPSSLNLEAEKIVSKIFFPDEEDSPGSSLPMI